MCSSVQQGCGLVLEGEFCAICGGRVVLFELGESVVPFRAVFVI